MRKRKSSRGKNPGGQDIISNRKCSYKFSFSKNIKGDTKKEAWVIVQHEFRGDNMVRSIKLQSLRGEFD